MLCVNVIEGKKKSIVQVGWVRRQRIAALEKFSLLYCTCTPQQKPGAFGEFISSSIGHVLYTDMQECLL